MGVEMPHVSGPGGLELFFILINGRKRRFHGIKQADVLQAAEIKSGRNKIGAEKRGAKNFFVQHPAHVSCFA